MDFEAQTLRRSMSTPGGVQFYSMEDDLFDLALYQNDEIYSAKMDRSHTTTNLCYMDSANDLLATPQSVQFARPRKTASLSTPHHHSFTHSQHHSNSMTTNGNGGDSGLLTPASINSTPGYHNSLQQHQHHQQFNMPCTPHPQVKLDFTTPKSVAMSHSMSDLGPQTQSPTGVNPFYSPPSYLSSTPMSATHSLVTPRATHNNSPAEDLSPNSCSQTASSFSSTTPSTSTSSFTLPYTLPPSPVMTGNILENSHGQLSSPQDYITAGGSSSSSSTGSPKSQARLAADFALRAAISSANPPPLLVSSSSLSSMAARRPGRPPKSLDHKPHKCQLCAKSFRRLEHLKRHAKVHTEERPFQCDVQGCERKFSRSDNLRAHRKTHMKKGGRNVFIEGLDG